MSAQQSPDGVLDVLVVDDHRAFADAIALAINIEPDLRCSACVGTAQAAMESVAEACPAVVLLDVSLPGGDGIEAIRPLREACPELRIIVLTASTAVESMVAAIEAGADGFLPKQQPFADVLEAIRSEDSFFADPATMAQMLRVAAREGRPDAGEVPALTDREHEILLYLADAHSVKEVASALDISVHTCRGHVRAILAKFEAHSQLEAVVRAARLRMLPRLYTTDV